MRADRRQTTLSVLREQTTPISLDALARAVAVREHKADVAEAVIDTVKVSLHHNHLPKMADLDVLDYDPEAQQIR